MNGAVAGIARPRRSDGAEAVARILERILGLVDPDTPDIPCTGLASSCVIWTPAVSRSMDKSISASNPPFAASSSMTDQDARLVHDATSSPAPPSFTHASS
jgi:hypothetical protein